MTIQGLDDSIVLYVNSFAGRSAFLDWLLDKAPTPSLTILPLVALLWWCWFEGGQRNRRGVVVALSGAVIALVISRVVQDLMPHRARPIYSGLPLRPLIGGQPDVVSDWSSFPSDHAAMALAICLGLWFVSRRLGVFAVAWSIVAICFPRLYTAVHYPSDLIGGGLIGLASAGAVAMAGKAVDWTVSLAEAIERRHPPLFYTAGLVVAVQVSTMLADLRGPLMSFLRMVHHA